MVFGCLFLHKYTCDGSGCETEYVWGTCVDLIRAYFYHWRTLPEVETWNQWNVDTVCMDVNLSGFRMPIASQIHMWWQWLWDRVCVGYLCGLDSGIEIVSSFTVLSAFLLIFFHSFICFSTHHSLAWHFVPSAFSLFYSVANKHTYRGTLSL